MERSISVTCPNLQVVYVRAEDDENETIFLKGFIGFEGIRTTKCYVGISRKLLLSMVESSIKLSTKNVTIYDLEPCLDHVFTKVKKDGSVVNDPIRVYIGNNFVNV